MPILDATAARNKRVYDFMLNRILHALGKAPKLEYKGFDRLVGHYTIKANAEVIIKACIAEKVPFPHCLVTGIPGTGKTTLTAVVAEHMGHTFVETHAATIRSWDDVVKLFKKAIGMSNGKPFVLMVDEIHNLPRDLQEALYDPMYKGLIQLPDGNQITIPPFSLFAASSRPEELDDPFVERFRERWNIGRYEADDLIILINDWILAQNMFIEGPANKYLSERTRGLPRRAIHLITKARMVAIGDKSRTVTMAHAKLACDLEEVDCLGLERIHREYLKALLDAGQSGLSLANLAAKLATKPSTILSAVEPALTELDLIRTTLRGRALAEAGHRHLATEEMI